MNKFSELSKEEHYKAFQNCDFMRDRLYEIVKEQTEDEIESEIILLNKGIDDYDFEFKNRKNGGNYLIPQSHRKFVDTLRDHRDKFWYVCHYMDDLDEDLCFKCRSDEEADDAFNWYAPHIIDDIVRYMNYRMDYVDYAFEKFNADFRSYVDAYGYGTSFDDCYVIDGKIYELHEIGSLE